MRRYHREYYRPSNLFLIVTGSVELEALLAAVGTFDAHYAQAAATPTASGGDAPSSRPFSAPVPDMPLPPPWNLTWTPPAAGEGGGEEESSAEEEETKGEAEPSAEAEEAEAEPVELCHMGVHEVAVAFPSEDESCGTVVLGWRTEPFGPELPLQVLVDPPQPLGRCHVC